VDDVARSIVAHADELGHDLVVMCSHGRGRALHLMLGSIAQSVIALGSLPVLITHPAENGTARAFSCRNILVPLDREPDHAQALPVSRELARACGATLHLVAVIPNLTTLSGDMTVTGRMLPGTTSRMLELAYQDAREYFGMVEAELQGEGVAASSHVLRGDPARTIIAAAERSRVDLIVLATHGKKGMTALWAGSVAHKICSKSMTPLLLVPVAKA
jgi:nucleotide-binding universal stress UspA family protein